MRRFFGIGTASRARRSNPPRLPDVLDPRRLPTATPADISILAIRAQDANHLAVDYQVDPGGAFLTALERIPVTFYRSTDATLSPDDLAITTKELAGPSSALPTTSTVRSAAFDVPDLLAINPGRPYVLAVVDPSNQVPESSEANNLASLRKTTLVVVTHGGLQITPGDRIPSWQNRMGKRLAAEGYDGVLLFNWVSESSHPGAVANQGLRLAKQIREKIAEMAPEGPVDLHTIGHSQGTVVNGLALRALQDSAPPQLHAGYVQETMIDPHAATGGARFKQYSTKDSFMGRVARILVNDYQGRADDPPPLVPDIVDRAEVFYQHTYYAFAPTPEQHWLNLWGQVPVPGEARYVDITGIGIAHSGYYSVINWYREHVLPQLDQGAAFSIPDPLTAQMDPRDGTVLTIHEAKDHIPERRDTRAHVANPRFTGTSWPGATVVLAAAPLTDSTSERIPIGRAVADADGEWSFESRPLPPGRYSVVATASIPASRGFPRVRMTPRIRVGTVEIPRDT